MTTWHAEWQSYFPITEQIFRRKGEQIKERRADAVLPEYKKIIEFQHSEMTSGEVNDRIHDYGLHDHQVSWILDSQDCIKVKSLGDRIILHFTDKLWLYESFVHPCEAVYYDIGGLIYKVNPKMIRSHQVDVQIPKSKIDFIKCLKSNTDPWMEDELHQCHLYIKQQGAGSGKTYGMMQLLNSDMEIASYKYIALITKQHSAVHIMFSEFMNQYKSGKLSNITITDEPVEPYKKQRIVTYTHKLTGATCTAIFATVDSFTYAVGDNTVNSYDKFVGIVESIKKGTIRTDRDGLIRFAGVNPILNKELLIMIDETQDLTELYGEAFLQIVLEKHTNLCVVGDSLQSLAYEENALTFLQKVQKPLMKVIKSDSSNNVRRFTNDTLIHFVNEIVPFADYDLPSISAATDVPKDTRESPLSIFSIKCVYANEDHESDNVSEVVSEIMTRFEKEVELNHRKPEDFLFVTPFATKNPVMEALQIALNVYWKTTMETNHTYIAEVKEKDEYWKDVDTSLYNRYAIFHKSEEGTSINLEESKKATRMVTIHSSKGDGRPVVFVYGVKEQALQKFGQVTNSLIYNSLLHVAVTRQKERLYFAVEKNNDDIHRRILKASHSIEPAAYDFDIKSSKTKIPDIANYIADFCYDDFYENTILPHPPLRLEPTKEDKLILDMGDHMLRYASMFMNIVVHCCNFALEGDMKQQLVAILYKLEPDCIAHVDKWQGYIAILHANKKIKYSKDTKIKGSPKIPVMSFPSRKDNVSYDIYHRYIILIMHHVMEDIREYLGKKPLRFFCPLECVILFYMIECINNPSCPAISINDLYNIIHVYNVAFSPTLSGHDLCKCKEMFSSEENSILSVVQKKYYDYLFNHYNNLTRLTKMLESFSKSHPAVKWLYKHSATFDGNCEGFKINNQFELIAYDEEAVYLFYIKPQFTELNYNEVTTKTLLDAFLISNVSKTTANYERFNGKVIKSCVVSLSHENIYTMDWSTLVKERSGYIRTILYNMLTNKYSNAHDQLHKTFVEIVNSDSAKKPMELMNLINEKVKKAKYPPSYIVTAFSYISGRIMMESRKAMREYLDRNSFVSLMDKSLETSLKTYLNINDEDDEDDEDEE